MVVDMAGLGATCGLVAGSQGVDGKKSQYLCLLKLGSRKSHGVRSLSACQTNLVTDECIQCSSTWNIGHALKFGGIHTQDS